ncbi:MAG: flagellar type III secretion system pore protein FliP [Legionellales bacterium]|nr:flagellar type III secretion system pore protein FliP [Legionellales bacterium]
MLIAILISVTALLLISQSFAAIPDVTALTVKTASDGGTTYSVSLKILGLMTLLMVLPALLMTMTSFTRIIIVLSILRQALGMPSVPTNQILIGLALFLTLFVMSPIFTQVNQQAIQPLMQNQISEQQALDRALMPFRKFMSAQTRSDDLKLFLDLSRQGPVKNINEVPFYVLMPAFLTSELKTAFQIGFILFIPFLIIDLVVASVLMSMGMMMLAPPIVSLPFKVMLFVMVNGWVLIIGTLARSFGPT